LGKQFIKDLKIGSPVQSQFVVIDIQELSYSAPSRSGESFLKLTLGDVTGSIKGVIWNRAMVTEPIRQDEVLLISGEVKDYHGPQLNINHFEKISKEHINRAYFQAVSARDTQKMWAELLEIIDTDVTDNDLRELLRGLFADEHILQKFLTAPAAKTIHHNYIGGLLEHTLEVIEICLKFVELYPHNINKSLLITGAIFHDLGKIEEYDQESFTFQKTDPGYLLGHITIGLGILREQIKKVSSFPGNLGVELEHMLISHHGEKEWGSPEVPQTINAFALFHADLVSARLKQFMQIAEAGNKEELAWSRFDRFLGRKVFTGWGSEEGN
jgi:3'-5' exoribonuclease